MNDPALPLAVSAVRRAARVCEAVRAGMVTEDTLQKKDKSPVTVADFASQAVICGLLSAERPDEPILAEEDAAALRGDNAAMAPQVARYAAEGLAASPSETQVLDWIDAGSGSTQGPRYWCLDPIDGTKGFLRGEQYAIALARLEGGLPVCGVLGCPRLHGGTLLVATRGGGTGALPLHADADDDVTGATAARAKPASDIGAARFCESVESGHSDQDLSGQIAQRLGITAEPVRMDSQAKYAAVAQGDAQIYLRVPTDPTRSEKIWDHAAGALTVWEAGGRVTDLDGRELDFGQGAELTENRGILATDGQVHDELLQAIAAVAPSEA